MLSKLMACVMMLAMVPPLYLLEGLFDRTVVVGETEYASLDAWEREWFTNAPPGFVARLKYEFSTAGLQLHANLQSMAKDEYFFWRTMLMFGFMGKAKTAKFLKLMLPRFLR